MKILITGANFENKGAQSMLFITADEIRKRAGNAEIYFSTSEKCNLRNYRFKSVYLTTLTQKIALSKHYISLPFIKNTLRDCIRFILGRKKNIWQFTRLRELMPDIDVIIDVSGFALGQKWSAGSQEDYLNNIRIAKKYNIPMYLMPQSFGGFSYSDDKKYLLPEIKELLKYPRVIFAREKAGYTELTKRFRLNNVKLSADLVLQNKSIELSNIYRKIPDLTIPELKTSGNTAIIPNMQCFKHGDREKNLALYKSIIDSLISMGRHVYIFRHSAKDFEICQLIYDMYGKNKNLHLLTNDFSCIEYDRFINQFDFIICSRFHGIVHAYRNGIPAIALGWEIKYTELTARMSQEKFCFNITDDNLKTEDIISAVKYLDSNYGKERNVIENRLTEIRRDNCFDAVSELH